MIIMAVLTVSDPAGIKSDYHITSIYLFFEKDYPPMYAAAAHSLTTSSSEGIAEGSSLSISKFCETKHGATEPST